jgi:purine-nucleoside phosphorylase
MSNNNLSFSFIELKAIGSPVIMDYILSLGVTKCKNIIFIGSAGSIDEKIKIGDLVIPNYSICGDGASRYLNDNFEDEFGKKEIPSKILNEKLINLLNHNKIDYHCVPNFSVDNVFSEFYHLDKILEYGSKTVEMETANFFKCCNLIGINGIAIFAISDNIISKSSLFNGRSEEEKRRKDYCKEELIPKLVIDLIEEL